MKRIAPILLTTLLLVTGCASGEPEGVDDTVTIAEDEKDDAAKDGKGSANGDKKKDGKRGPDKQRKRSDESPEEASADGNGTGGGGAGEDRDEGVSANRGSGSTNSTQPYPAAGTYTFAQSGYEEFCDSAGRCDKENLPSRQPTKLSYDQRTDDSAVVVMEQQAGSRVARSWTRFTPSGAHITKLYVRMVYSGFRFERTYVPQPPVEAFRFPFQEGEAWSGRWKAQTSGTYSVRIGAPREIEIGGRTVTAYPVDTTTTFTGDFEGRSRITALVDPRTKSVVASDGALNVTSQFGRYSTVFETKLLGGPGY
jgi:hypothetical protein